MKARLVVMTLAAGIWFFMWMPAVLAQDSAGKNKRAKDLLEKITAARQAVRNFQCVATYHAYKPLDALEKEYELLKKKGWPEPKLARFKAAMFPTEQDQHWYSTETLAFDNTGRARLERLRGRYDSAEAKGPVNSRYILTWDGASGVQYVEDASKKRPGAVISDRPCLDLTERGTQPWLQFGGNFCRFFSEVIEQGADVDVGESENGTIRIAFNRGAYRHVGCVDPGRGFSVVNEQVLYKDRPVTRRTADFSEVIPGVWFPVAGEEVQYFRDDPDKLEMRISVKVSAIKINDPNFGDGLFEVDFPEGTRVTNTLTGLQYVVGEQMSEKPHGVSHAYTLGQVAAAEIERFGDERAAVNEPERMEVFIPKAQAARRKNAPFVLDTKSATLVNPLYTLDSESAYKALLKLGKGDVAWDGSLVVVRKGKALTVAQESHRPLETAPATWCTRYKLAEDMILPYSLLIVTGENREYFLITIEKLEAAGITIKYRKLDADEVKLKLQRGQKD